MPRFFVLMFVFLLAGCAAVKDAGLPKAVWTLAEYRCPFGCSPEMEAIVKPRLNRQIHLDGRELSDSFFGPCAKNDLIVEIQSKEVAQILDEMNANLPAGMMFTAENTGIQGDTVQTAHVYCKDKKFGRRTLAWVISIKPGEMITFEEDATLLVYK